MTDEYLKARKAGEKEYRAKTAAGEYPYLPALDDIREDTATLPQQNLGIMEIPTDLIAGTRTRARQNSFAPNFMPLLEPDTEFAAKWSSLYRAQLEEGFNNPIRVYEYLHRFYVLEGNKRVSVSRFLDMPVITAEVIRLIPDEDALEQHPVYAEFLRFYKAAPIYDIEPTWEGAYSEIAELMGLDLEHPWQEDTVKALRNLYWNFTQSLEELGGSYSELAPSDAFMIYLRLYIKDALRHQPPKVITKRIQRIKNELLTEKNRDRIALVESSEDALKAGSLLSRTETAVSRVLPNMSYSPKHPLKAAFIYDKTISGSGRVSDHERGRKRLEKSYGGTVSTKYWEDCGEQESFDKAVEEAVDWGAEVIFSTSPSQLNYAHRAAIEHKEIKFLNCSINHSRQAVRSYYAKLYEAKFLAGIVAGQAAAADGTHRIGYSSDYPIFGTIASVNAFAMGAAMADPQVKVYLEWATRQGVNWWWSFVDKGIHVISAMDSLHSQDGSEAYGVCYVEKCEEGQGNDLSGSCCIRHLAAPVLKWGKLYEMIIKTVLEGNYNAHLVDKKDQATNYWWGMISGVVDTELADDLPPYTRKLVEILRREIIEGRFNPFEMELKSQDGLIRTEKDRGLSSRDIIEMDWLNENIIGEIPEIGTLVEEAQPTVKLSGVEKTKQPRNGGSGSK